MHNDKPIIVLAAGGTGGHIFPAEALAAELEKQGQYKPVLVTDKRFLDYDLPEDSVLSRIEIRTIRTGRFGKGIFGKIFGGCRILFSIWQGMRALKTLKPALVIGFGGYPSFPTMFAATRLGVKTVIHEQNAVLGKANRLVLDKVDVIATSFEEVRFISDKQKEKALLIGNPVRSAIRSLNDIPYPKLSEDGAIRVLVFGGSQGATIFSDIVPAAMVALPASLRARVRIDQQCRAEDIESVRAAYESINMQVDLATFFTDIPARLASAHLVICRAGASTIAELTAAGRPAILVPYPNAADNHQYANATAIEDADAGWVIPQEGFTAAALSTRIESFLNLPLSLSKVAKQAKSLAHLDAAQHLSLLVSFMIKGYALEDIRAKLAPIDKPKPSVKPAVKKNKLAA